MADEEPTMLTTKKYESTPPLMTVELKITSRELMKEIHTKTINDPIYGFISINKRLFDIIDHPIFQCLRDIK